MCFGDIFGVLISDGELIVEYIGKINLFLMCVYVVVYKKIVIKVLNKIVNGKMKGC